MNGYSILNRRPAVRIVLLLIAGIFFAESWTLSPQLLYLLTAGFLLMGLSFWPFPRFIILSSVFLSVSVILAGASLYSSQRQTREELRLEPREVNESVQFVGTVGSKPVQSASSIRFIAEVQVLQRASETLRRPWRVIVQAKKGDPKDDIVFQVGSSINVKGILEPLPLPRNPYEFNYGRYLDLNDIHGIVRVAHRSDLQHGQEGEKATLLSLLGKLRTDIAGVLDRQHDPAQASFLKGILLADRGEISPELKQSFIDTGTIHVLAVSGLHVGVVAIIFYTIFGLLRLKKQAVVLATIVGLVAYALLTGSAPSVVRATIMASIILLGQLLARKADIYNSLSVAAMVILLWDPKQLFNVGFQLSFAAVLSIVTLYPIFDALIRKIPERFEEIKAIDYVLKLFAVSLAAQIGTLPFTALYFERVSIVSLFANVVVVPIVGLNLMLGFAGVITTLVSEWIASCYSALNNLLVAFLLGFVKAASSVPFAFVETSHLSARFSFLYYVAVTGIFFISTPRIRNRALIVTLFMVNIFLFRDVVSAEKSLLKFTAIDVGQGDALLIEFPNGRNMLIDAGPKTFSFDAGKKIIVPLLKRSGIADLDAVLITHPHSDHIGGLPYILDHMSVGRIIQSNAFSSSGIFGAILRKADSLRVPIRTVSVGDTILIDPSTRLYVLHPKLPNDSTSNLNNTSVVVKLLYGSTSFLLTGDAEKEAERTIVNRYKPMLSSSAVKVGHHGSSTSSSDEFLNVVRATTAIVSVGRNNKFRHPSTSVLERMRAMEMQPLRTDLESAIVLQSDGTNIKRVHWRD